MATTFLRPAPSSARVPRAIVAFVLIAYGVSWGWSFALVALGETVRQGVAAPRTSRRCSGRPWRPWPSSWPPAVAAA